MTKKRASWQNIFLAFLGMLALCFLAFRVKLLFSAVSILLQPVVLGAAFGMVLPGFLIGFKKSEWLPVITVILVVFWILLPGTGAASSLLLGGTVSCGVASLPSLAGLVETVAESIWGKRAE